LDKEISIKEMGRELEIEKDEEAVSLATFQQPKMPYQAV
jgi:hypothetical protein